MATEAPAATEGPATEPTLQPDIIRFTEADFAVFSHLSAVVDAARVGQYPEERLIHLKETAVDGLERVFAEMARIAPEVGMTRTEQTVLREIGSSPKIYGSSTLAVHEYTLPMGGIGGVELFIHPPDDGRMSEELTRLSMSRLGVRVSNDGAVWVSRDPQRGDWEPVAIFQEVNGRRRYSDAALAKHLYRTLFLKEPSDAYQWHEMRCDANGMKAIRRKHLADTMPELLPMPLSGDVPLGARASLYQRPEGAARLAIVGPDASKWESSIFISAAGEICDPFEGRVRTDSYARYLIFAALTSGMDARTSMDFQTAFVHPDRIRVTQSNEEQVL